jgi:hypothetical protein
MIEGYHAPFVALLPKRLVCLSYAGQGTIHVRVNNDGVPTHIVPRAGGLKPSEVVPHPLAQPVVQTIRDLLRGDVRDLWFARGIVEGVPIAGLVKAECRVKVGGKSYYQAAVIPVSPDRVIAAYGEASRVSRQQGKIPASLILPNPTPSEPTEAEQGILERILKRMDELIPASL